MKDYGFAKHTVPAEVEALEDACYKAGVRWWQQGNKTLPRIATVNGKQVPVVRSTGSAGQSFVRGWKAAKSNRVAIAA